MKTILRVASVVAIAALPAGLSAQATATKFEVAGIPVILKPVTANEVVAVRLYLRGGSASLTSSNAGIERMMLDVSTQGTAKFDKDRFGRLTVDLDAGEGMVRCDFPRGTENQLEKLKPTQKVTIRGRCTGRDRKDLIKLEDCILVSRK